MTADQVLKSIEQLTGKNHAEWVNGVHIDDSITDQAELFDLLSSQVAIPLFVDDATAEKIATIASVPRRLELQHVSCIDADFLDALRGCEFLEFFGSSGEREASVRALSGSSRLQHLKFMLSTPRVTDAWLEHISRISGLRTLKIGSKRFTDTGVACLARLTRLENFYISAEKATDDGFSFLSDLNCLRKLIVSGHIDGTCIVDIASNLTHLSMASHRKEGLDRGTLQEILQEASQLQALQLRGSQMKTVVNDEVLDVLAGLDALIDLELDHLRISRDSLALISDSCNLKKLSIAGTNVNDQDLTCLASATSLTELNLQCCDTIRGDAFPDLPQSLQRLHISDCSVRRRGLNNLQHLENLRYLTIGDCDETRTYLEDEWLEELVALPNLIAVTILPTTNKDAVSHLTRNAIDILSKSKSIQYVQVFDWGADDAASEGFWFNGTHEGCHIDTMSKSWMFRLGEPD